MQSHYHVIMPCSKQYLTNLRPVHDACRMQIPSLVVLFFCWSILTQATLHDMAATKPRKGPPKATSTVICVYARERNKIALSTFYAAYLSI